MVGGVVVEAFNGVEGRVWSVGGFHSTFVDQFIGHSRIDDRTQFRLEYGPLNFAVIVNEPNFLGDTEDVVLECGLPGGKLALPQFLDQVCLHL